MESYLPVIWAAIIGCAVAMYVILDGFDLGIGILFPFAESEHERDQMMNSVAPFWDGNETWLVLGGAGLMVAFPLAYSIILPSFYLPVIIMLLALVFRGVAFEFPWLVMKTEGKIRERARPTAKALLVVVLAFMAIVSLWTPLAFDRIAARWFSLPNILFLWWIPVATALVAFVAWRAIESGREALPFLATIALFLLGYLGLLISNFPYIVPPSLTIWQAAAAPATPVFMLMGTLVMLPIIFGYTIFVYWIFSGKLREGEGYH